MILNFLQSHRIYWTDNNFGVQNKIKDLQIFLQSYFVQIKFYNKTEPEYSKQYNSTA